MASSASTIRIIKRVDQAAEVPGDRPPERAEHDRDRGRAEADLERRLPADHQPAELVVADVVGAERVIPARRQCRLFDVSVDLVGVVDERADEAEEHDQHDA